jgi:glycosyltransferase involved in cell wall biosynthesis
MSVYNGENFLHEAVKSVLDQTFTDFEFVIVNDGSNLTTRNMLEYWTALDKRIILINNVENIGLTKSINKALACTNGVYVARMDADDISYPDRLEKQVNYMEKNRSTKCLGTNVIIIDEEGNRKNNLKLNEFDLKKRLFKRNSLVHGSLMFEAEALRGVGGYNERFVLAQDYDLLLRLAEKYEVGCHPDLLYQLRSSKDNLSTKKFFRQLYFTAVAKYEHELRVKNTKHRFLIRLIWIREFVYTFCVIGKFGLPKLFRYFS